MKSEHEWRRSFARSALSMLLLAAACGKSSLAPSEVLSQSTTTAHFDFRFASGDAVDAPRQEAFHDWIVARLGVSGTQRMTFNKYRDRNHLEKATGMSTNGFADPSTATVHSIWTWDAHEAVHVYTAAIGRPSDFFNEGIAVALSTDPLAGRFVSLWNNTPIHQIAADTLRAGLIPPLSTMVETEAYRIRRHIRWPDRLSATSSTRTAWRPCASFFRARAPTRSYLSACVSRSCLV
jgi:hypothetical protein